MKTFYLFGSLKNETIHYSLDGKRSFCGLKLSADYFDELDDYSQKEIGRFYMENFKCKKCLNSSRRF